MRSTLTSPRDVPNPPWDWPRDFLWCPEKKAPCQLQLSPASWGVSAWWRCGRQRTTVGGKQNVKMFFSSQLSVEMVSSLECKNTNKKTLNSPYTHLSFLWAVWEADGCPDTSGHLPVSPVSELWWGITFVGNDTNNLKCKRLKVSRKQKLSGWKIGISVRLL